MITYLTRILHKCVDDVSYMNMGSYVCCSGSRISAERYSAVAMILKTVSEESRMKLLCLLCQGEHCVGEMMTHLSMSQSLVSHHLRDLNDAGIVQSKKVGVKVFYSLTPYGRTLAKALFKIPDYKKLGGK